MKSYQTTVVTRDGRMPESAISVLGAAGIPVAVYIRPDYTMHQAQQVVDWLNGQDKPLKMVQRYMDDWDPAIRYPLKKPRRRR